MADNNNSNVPATSDSSNSGAGKKNPLATIFKWLVIADIVWAIIVATLSATVINTAGSAAGATDVAMWIGTVGIWIVTFLVAMFQGAVFIGIVSIFGFVGLVLYNSAKKNKS